MVDISDSRLKIERKIEDRMITGERRGYLGLSQIGHFCSRALWYDFRFCSKKEYSARVGRLLQRGHREEPVIIADLKRAGVIVHSDQLEIIDGYGHIKGHIDGIGENIPGNPKIPHLLEFKTMKEGVTETAKRKPTHFHKLKRYGVKYSTPIYYAQCQSYMCKLNLTHTLFIAVNKNTDERYYQIIKLYNPFAEACLAKGVEIVLSEAPLSRPFAPGQDRDWRCNRCDHKKLCLEGYAPERNCRTCQYCDMHDKGRWSCSSKSSYGKEHWLDLDDQIKGCKDWRILNTLR